MHFVRLASCFGIFAMIAMVLAGCGSSGSKKISAGTYVSTVCSAIAPLEKDVVNRSSALNNSTAANASQAKAALRGFLQAVAQDSDHALSRIKSAGTPDISSGSSVAAAVVTAFTQLRDAMQAAVVKSRSLPTSSPAAFKSAAQALGAGVRSSLNDIDGSGLRNPDLEQAAAKQAACKSLTS